MFFPTFFSIPKKISKTTRILVSIVLSTGVLLVIFAFSFLQSVTKETDELISDSKIFSEDLYYPRIKEQTLSPLESYSTTTVPILVYHKISSKNPFFQGNHHLSEAYSVTDEHFTMQMKFLADQGYTTLTMRDLLTRAASSTLPQKPVAVTFDDGWRSQYEIALPILLYYHMTGTFYIYTDVIGSPLFMTMDQLRAITSLHMEIGGHTKHHPKLSKINPRRYKEELEGSKKTLERNLSVQVADFAYPYGMYNDKVIKELKKYGYLSGRTSKKGTINDFKDPFDIKVLYAPDDIDSFKKMLDPVSQKELQLPKK